MANAGFQHVAPVAEFPEDRWDALLAILLTSPFRPLRLGGARRERERALRRDRLRPLPWWPRRSRPGTRPRSTGALGLVKTLALEGAEQGITATAVCPAFVRTPLVEGQIAGQAKAHGMPEEDVLERLSSPPRSSSA